MTSVRPVVCCVCVTFAFLSVAFPVSLLAQAAARPSAPGAAPSVGNILKVRQSRVVGRVTMVATPEFRTNVPRDGGRPQEWSKMEVVYDTAPEWIDVLTVKFHVLTVAKLEGKPGLSVFRDTIDFVDIQQGREHIADAYLRPKTVARYGEPAAVHVEFSVAGEVVGVLDEFDSSMKGKVPPDWYDNQKFLGQDIVTVRDGYLLNRTKTPFALVNMESHEDIR